jgi:hypothetical protein
MTAGRTRLAAAVALLAAAVVGALLLAGGAQGDDGKLAWKDAKVFRSGVATDRILAAKVANTSLREVDLDVRNLRVLDAQGAEVRSAARFREAFAHGIFPWSARFEGAYDDFERRRLGEVLTLKPGEAAPITLSWRVGEDGRKPRAWTSAPSSSTCRPPPAARSRAGRRGAWPRPGDRPAGRARCPAA